MDKFAPVGLGRKNLTLSAVVTHADGSVDDLGVIAAHYSNPFKRFLWNLRHRTGRISF